MIRVLIVDDQKTIQQFLKSSLEADPDLEIVGFAADGQQAIEQVEQLRPDVILMDINMPVLDGLTATRIISERYVETKILILSFNNDDEHLSEALEVGAKGYLFKNTASEEIIIAIRSVQKGYFQLGPGLLEKYLYKLTITPRIHAEVNKKIDDAMNVIDQNKNYKYLLKDTMSNISKLKKSESEMRNLIYFSFIFNFVLVIINLLLLINI